MDLRFRFSIDSHTALFILSFFWSFVCPVFFFPHSLGFSPVLFILPALTVHVPLEAVAVPAGVQQQSGRVVLLQAPLHEAGPDPVAHHDPAHPLLLLVPWTSRGAYWGSAP